jgi:hypothetical protein
MGGFTDKQEIELKKFKEKHRNCVKPDNSIERYRFTYLETPTGIGPIDEIRCNNCGEIKDVTDVDSW